MEIKKCVFSVTKFVLMRIIVKEVDKRTGEKRMTTDGFNTEMQLLRPVLIKTAIHYVADEIVAEDVVQDALLRLWRMHKDLRMPVEPLAKVIVRNLCVSYLRHQKPCSPLANTDVRDTDEVDMGEERVERVLNIIDALPEKQRLLLRLRHMEGMEMKDIARLMQMEEPAIRKALSRARQAVRNHFLYER